MKAIFPTLTLIIFLLFTNIVLAENEVDIKVIPISSEIEAGSTAEYYLNITNLKLEKDIYRLSYDSLSIYPFSEYIRSIVTDPAQLKLDTGETGLLKVSIKTLDTAHQDITYETEIAITSLTNSKIAVPATLKTYIVSPTDLILIFPEIPEEIVPGEETQIKIRFKNRGSIALKNYEILISSDLPQLHKNFITDFSPQEEIIETISLKTSKNVKPGDYIVNIKVYDEDSKTRGSYSSAFTVSKNENIREQKDEDTGFLSKTTRITVTNEGNIKTTKSIEVETNFFARIFTKTNPDPVISKGNYVWELSLNPGDELSVEYVSNYRPIFYGILIIIIATLIMNYLVERSVLIRKRIYRIKRNPDGLSELKVLIHVKNGRKDEVSGVNIIDVLPSTMTPTEEFGTLKPTKIQQGTKGKRFIWELDKLAPQEERIFSYKVKSNIKLIGETRLPPAVVQYRTKKGKVLSERSADLYLDHTPKRE